MFLRGHIALLSKRARVENCHIIVPNFPSFLLHAVQLWFLNLYLPSGLLLNSRDLLTFRTFSLRCPVVQTGYFFTQSFHFLHSRGGISRPHFSDSFAIRRSHVLQLVNRVWMKVVCPFLGLAHKVCYSPPPPTPPSACWVLKIQEKSVWPEGMATP